MTKTDRIRAAREAANVAAQALIDHDREAEAAKVASALANKKAIALHHRATVVLVTAPSEIVRHPITMTGLAYGSIDDPKKLRAALESGEQKVTANGGITYGIKGLAAKMRVPSKLNLKAIDAATRLEARARERWSRATQARKDVEKAAWEAGEKVTPERLIDAVVARAKVRKGLSPTTYGGDWKRDNLVRTAEQANQHLTATREGAECPCQDCAIDRREAAERQTELDRRATLPTIMVKCAEHGRKRMPTEHRDRTIAPEKAQEWGLEKWGVHNLPLAYCPVGPTSTDRYPTGHVIALITQYKAELAKAAKAEAKARAAAKKLGNRPPPVVGDEITFRCPSCGELTSEAEVYGDDDDGDPLVQCANCGQEMLANGVAIQTASKAA